MAGRSSGTSVTSRVFAILGTFDEQHRAQTLTDIAGRAGLSLPTAHRLVGELAAWGALRRDPSGRYVVGRRMWTLGLLAPVQTGLREIAEPFLHDIYGTTLAAVHLAVREGDRVLYIDRLAGHASVPLVSKVGSRLPLHATAVGKVLLAHAPEDVRRRVLAGPLERATPYTITEPARLERQLARVRQEGYATTVEEMSLGGCSVGVPISVPAGAGSAGGTGGSGGAGQEEVIAALGIVVPDLRRTKSRLVAALQVAANGIARQLRTLPRSHWLPPSESGA